MAVFRTLKNGMKKQVMLAVLVLCTLLVLSMPAAATQTGHIHCCCGTGIMMGDHTTHTSEDWSNAWGNDSFFPSDDDVYYLIKDIVLQKNWEITGEVRLCLNGYTINLNGHYIKVSGADASLLITDCQGTGMICCGVNNESGGVVHIENGGSFTMYEGTLRDNDSSSGRGGAVYVGSGSSFTMYGGLITQNSVVVGNNNPSHGGGVYVDGNGTFTMYGGAITANYAKSYANAYGGGVYVAESATFNMQGGEISGNYAESEDNSQTHITVEGGGVYVATGSKISMSGPIVIYANMANGMSDNVYLESASKTRITITAPILLGAIIGVDPGDMSDETRSITDGWNNHMENTAPTLIFVSDRGDCSVEKSSSTGEVMLKKHSSGHAVTYEDDGGITEYGSYSADKTQDIAAGVSVAITVTPKEMLDSIIMTDKVTVMVGSVELYTTRSGNTYYFVMPYDDVKVKVTFKEAPVYEIRTDPNEETEQGLLRTYGVYHLSEKVYAGSNVGILVVSKDGYIVDKVTVTTDTGEDIPVILNQFGRYRSFIMPADDVTVKATFKLKPVVANAPKITQQPEDVTCGKEEKVTLNVEASVTDGGTLTYQWYSNTVPSNKGGTEIAGATQKTYVDQRGAVGSVKYYYCVVTNTIATGETAKKASAYATITRTDAPSKITIDTDQQIYLYDGTVKHFDIKNTLATNFFVTYYDSTTSSQKDPVEPGTYHVLIGRDEDEDYYAFEIFINNALVIKLATPEEAYLPSRKFNIVYTGSTQPLVEAGTVLKGGKWLYSTDGTNYTDEVPTAKDIGYYTVHYKFEPDFGYADLNPSFSTGTFSNIAIRPGEPTGLLGISPTSQDGDDGKITGLNAELSYEYALDGDNPYEWKTCADGITEITGLKPGKYVVRVRGINGLPESLIVNVKVPQPDEQCTIYFLSNDGTDAKKEQMLAVGAAGTLQANTFTREGHTFTGWNMAANGSGVAYADGASVTPTSDMMTLYAQWQANEYTVTFNGNGHTGGVTMDPQPFTYGVAQPLTKNTFTRTGYVFADWNTVADGSGDVYADGASVTPTSDMTLYAQWAITTYTVIFDGNGHTGGETMDPQTFIYGDTTQALSENAFTRTGYTFAGWNTAADGSGTPFTDKQPEPNVSENGGTVTLFAQWKKNVIPTENASGMTVVDDLIIMPKENQTIPAAIGEKVTLKLSVSPEATAFQWFVDRGDGKGFVTIPDATKASYTTSALSAGNNGWRYYCAVMREGAGQLSPFFILQVGKGAALPSTGDAGRPALWFGAMTLAAAAFVLLRRRRAR